MAGPTLPTSITAGVTTGEVADTLAVYSIVKQFDTAIGTASANDVLARNTSTGVYEPEPLLSVLPAGVPIVIRKSGGVWPGVATTRTDLPHFWVGADPSPAIVSSRTLGSAGMLDNVDIRLITT
jgi:hypothetical protein